MSTPERCRARAEEAERLAGIVSYGRDKERLLAQAAELRQRAAELEATPPEPVETSRDSDSSGRKPLGWLRSWLPRRKGAAA